MQPTMANEQQSHSSTVRLGRDRLILIFFVYSLLTAGSFFYKYLDDLSRHHAGTLMARAIEEITGGYSSLLLLPLVFRFGRRYLFGSVGWLTRIGCHAAGSALFSALHTTVMWLSRAALFPLLGQGRYDYGDMVYRYPMEFSKDFFVYTVILIAYYVFEEAQKGHAHRLRTSKMETALAQAQLDNLKFQIHPHFLFNALNTISNVMYENVDAADEMLVKLSEIMRLTLHTPMLSEIPVSEELRITRLYLDLMQRRFDDRLIVHYNIEANAASCLVPQMILQPLVENSLRHGFKDRTHLELYLEARLYNETLVIQVADNGAGYNAPPVAVSGIGLANVRGRLKNLYDGEHRLSIANRVGGAPR